MDVQTLKKQTQNLLIFNKNSLRKLEPKKNALDANIKYWLQNRKTTLLKNGVYLITDRYQNETNKDLYLEYIANQLIKPSYLSLEYTLSKYQLLSEPANALTSVTVKTNREIINSLAAFRYYSISEKLFTGFKIKHFYDAIILEAQKSKAMFDFLYFRFIKNNEISKQSVENLRLNWENFSLKNFKEMQSYNKMAGNKRLNILFDIIQKEYYNPP